MLAIFDAELRQVAYGVSQPGNPHDSELEGLRDDLYVLRIYLMKAETFEARGVKHILSGNNYTITDAVGREIKVTTHDEALIVLSRNLPVHLGESKA